MPDGDLQSILKGAQLSMEGMPLQQSSLKAAQNVRKKVSRSSSLESRLLGAVRKTEKERGITADEAIINSLIQSIPKGSRKKNQLHAFKKAVRAQAQQGMGSAEYSAAFGMLLNFEKDLVKAYTGLTEKEYGTAAVDFHVFYDDSFLVVRPTTDAPRKVHLNPYQRSTLRLLEKVQEEVRVSYESALGAEKKRAALERKITKDFSKIAANYSIKDAKRLKGLFVEFEQGASLDKRLDGMRQKIDIGMGSQDLRAVQDYLSLRKSHHQKTSHARSKAQTLAKFDEVHGNLDVLIKEAQWQESFQYRAQKAIIDTTGNAYRSFINFWKSQRASEEPARGLPLHDMRSEASFVRGRYIGSVTGSVALASAQTIISAAGLIARYGALLASGVSKGISRNASSYGQPISSSEARANGIALRESKVREGIASLKEGMSSYATQRQRRRDQQERLKALEYTVRFGAGDIHDEKEMKAYRSATLVIGLMKLLGATRLNQKEVYESAQTIITGMNRGELDAAQVCYSALQVNGSLGRMLHTSFGQRKHDIGLLERGLSFSKESMEYLLRKYARRVRRMARGAKLDIMDSYDGVVNSAEYMGRSIAGAFSLKEWKKREIPDEELTQLIAETTKRERETIQRMNPSARKNLLENFRLQEEAEMKSLAREEYILGLPGRVYASVVAFAKNAKDVLVSSFSAGYFSSNDLKEIKANAGGERSRVLGEVTGQVYSTAGSLLYHGGRAMGTGAVIVAKNGWKPALAASVFAAALGVPLQGLQYNPGTGSLQDDGTTMTISYESGAQAAIPRNEPIVFLMPKIGPDPDNYLSIENLPESYFEERAAMKELLRSHMATLEKARESELSNNRDNYRDTQPQEDRLKHFTPKDDMLVVSNFKVDGKGHVDPSQYTNRLGERFEVVQITGMGEFCPGTYWAIPREIKIASEKSIPFLEYHLSMSLGPLNEMVAQEGGELQVNNALRGYTHNRLIYKEKGRDVGIDAYGKGVTEERRNEVFKAYCDNKSTEHAHGNAVDLSGLSAAQKPLLLGDFHKMAKKVGLDVPLSWDVVHFTINPEAPIAKPAAPYLASR